MSDHPIIFSATMIRALLDGRKTMTRRLAYRAVKKGSVDRIDSNGAAWRRSAWQRVKPIDRLWVRENFYLTDDGDYESAVYAADDGAVAKHLAEINALGPSFPKAAADRLRKLRPSIHMPRDLSRLTLVVTATKIERLQEISRDDAIAEGLKLVSNEIEEFFKWPPPFDSGTWLSPPAAFKWLWKRLHGDGAWDVNPEVVALTFAVHKANIDAMPKEKAA